MWRWCRDIDSRLPPVYRKDIPLHRTYFHDIAQPIKISYQLNALQEWMNSNEFRGFHPVKQASVAHWRFMHPSEWRSHLNLDSVTLKSYYGAVDSV